MSRGLKPRLWVGFLPGLKPRPISEATASATTKEEADSSAALRNDKRKGRGMTNR
jgi:hypothetical protein